MIRSAYALLIFTLVAWSPFVSGCEEFFDIGDNQVKETQEQIMDADNFDFDAIIAFERLMCSNRNFIRIFASEIGLASSNATIRSRALLAALMEKETITLESYFQENISNAEKEFVKQNSVLPFDVEFRNMDQSCISLRAQDKCHPLYTVSVEGDEVTLRFANKTARLSLNKEGELEGIYSEEKSEIRRVPVLLKLR